MPTARFPALVFSYLGVSDLHFATGKSVVMTLLRALIPASRGKKRTLLIPELFGNRPGEARVRL